jgi:hypothetical protein
MYASADFDGRAADFVSGFYFAVPELQLLTDVGDG